MIAFAKASRRRKLQKKFDYILATQKADLEKKILIMENKYKINLKEFSYSIAKKITKKVE